MPASAISPRVLISFSHDSSEHDLRVLSLADRLRSDGVDAMIDLYDPAPPDGWPLWMDRWLRVVDPDVLPLKCASAAREADAGGHEWIESMSGE